MFELDSPSCFFYSLNLVLIVLSRFPVSCGKTLQQTFQCVRLVQAPPNSQNDLFRYFDVYLTISAASLVVFRTVDPIPESLFTEWKWFRCHDETYVQTSGQLGGVKGRQPGVSTTNPAANAETKLAVGQASTTKQAPFILRVRGAVQSSRKGR